MQRKNSIQQLKWKHHPGFNPEYYYWIWWDKMEKLKCNKDNMPTAFSMSELRDSRVAGIEEDGDDDLDWTLIHFVWKRWEEMTWGAGGEDGEPLPCRSSWDMQPWAHDWMCRLLDLKVWKHVSAQVWLVLGWAVVRTNKGDDGSKVRYYLGEQGSGPEAEGGG